MFSSERSRSPPKIRLKMENHEKYESIFRNKFDKCFKPLNPPPPLAFNQPNSSIRNSIITKSDTHLVTPRARLEHKMIVPKPKKEDDPRQDTHDAAVLLASMKNLIEKEIHTCPPPQIILPSVPDLEVHFKRNRDIQVVKLRKGFIPDADAHAHQSIFRDPIFEKDEYENSRVRAVSMDSNHCSDARRSPTMDLIIQPVVCPVISGFIAGVPTCISPPASPTLRPVPLENWPSLPKSPRSRGADRRKRYLDDHLEDLDGEAEGGSDSESDEVEETHTTPRTKKLKLCKTRTARTTTTKKTPKSTKAILHKKFSWKNYPELEKFLIANREEYLRHSALNYTMQQKQYNNTLTERLVDLATECGYVFDEQSFTFVTIRDRIRCYFKSYVQSRKKRGVIIGYAARKAGLLSDEELERSSVTKGTIISAGSKRKK
jgi:hypothetical protein